MTQLESLICSDYPLTYVITSEEERLLLELDRILKDNDMHAEVHAWDIVNGVRPVYIREGVPQFGDSIVMGPDPSAGVEWLGERNKDTILLFLDIHRTFDDAQSVRALRNVLQLRHHNDVARTAMIVSPISEVPPELRRQVAVIDFDLPTRLDIAEYLAVKQKKAELGDALGSKPEDLTDIIDACRGLTLYEIENVLARAYIEEGKVSPEIVVREKKSIIRSSRSLQYYDTKESLENVGGLENIHKWLAQRRLAFSPKAREFGLPYPRGILLVGVPGGGKSLVCKAVCASWKIPLLQWNVGASFGKYLGETEGEERNVEKTSEAVAPCGLWADEIDKGLGASAAGGGATDGGTGARMVGSFLTWMEEKTEPVFVLATCNAIEGLGPLLRRGRFDEIFFVDVPNENALGQILEIHIRLKGRDPEKFDIPRLVERSLGLVGAEVKSAIEDALFLDFEKGQELSQESLETCLLRVIPHCITRKDEIARLRKWAEDKAQPAQSEPLDLQRALDLREQLAQQSQQGSRRSLARRGRVKRRLPSGSKASPKK